MELQTIDLYKEYDGGRKMAVNGVNLRLHKGVYGLLGANGAGKSTLMRLLTNLLRPSRGQILLDGQNIKGLGADYRRLLGYLPQNFAYYPDFTAREFLLYVAVLKGLNAAAAQKQAGQLLAAVGLSEQARRRQRIKSFSGGMKQRLEIAQALLGNPQILLFDEPTAGLDPTERVRFRQLLKVLAADCIVLLSTHIISDVALSAPEIILLENGRVVRSGRQAELMTEIGAANLEQVYLYYCQGGASDNVKIG